MERKAKFRYIVVLTITYFASTILLLIGYFTPEWMINMSEKQSTNVWNHFITQSCSTVGLISGSCRYPYPHNDKYSGDFADAMISVFWMMSSALFIVALSFTMVVVTFATDLKNNQVFISFMSVVFGVLYPMAAILVLVSSLLVVGKFHDEIGYSTYVTVVAGGLMMLFYSGLIGYDVMYANSRIKKQEKRELVSQHSGQEQ